MSRYIECFNNQNWYNYISIIITIYLLFCTFMLHYSEFYCRSFIKYHFFNLHFKDMFLLPRKYMVFLFILFLEFTSLVHIYLWDYFWFIVLGWFVHSWHIFKDIYVSYFIVKFKIMYSNSYPFMSLIKIFLFRNILR